jgi:hypothetical protein
MTLRSCFVALFAVTSLAGCALPAAEGESGDLAGSTERGAESVGRRIYLTPVDARARIACRDEDNRYYCSKASADAARAKCAAKVTAGGAAASDPCATGGDACVRARTTTETCTGDGVTYPTAASCDTPHPENCSYYSACLEAKLPCGESGYGLGYGEKYCNAFANDTGFSPAGVAWVNSTMLCLQKHLASLSTKGLASMTCDALTDDAFASHPACYTQPGASICDLGPSDALQVLRTISATDLLSSRALKQEASVVHTCVLHVVGRLFGARPPVITTSGTPAAFAAPMSSMSDDERAQLAERFEFWSKLDAELDAKLAR